MIDTPIEALPHVNEHVIGIDASLEEVWDALLDSLPRLVDSRPSSGLAALLGTEHRRAEGEFGDIGSTLPGFVVTRAVPPAVLALMGEHRFSRYALILRIEPRETCTALRAETRAVFPGAKGRAYRGLVIGSRAHVLATRRILTLVRRRAEQRAHA